MDGIDSVTLSPRYFAARAKIPADTLFVNRAKFDIVRAMEEDALILRLSSYVMTEDLKSATHTFTVSYPATWWQHFKKQVFPPWALTFWPVKERTVTETVTFDAYEAYPLLPASAFDSLARKHVFKLDLDVFRNNQTEES